MDKNHTHWRVAMYFADCLLKEKSNKTLKKLLVFTLLRVILLSEFHSRGHFEPELPKRPNTKTMTPGNFAKRHVSVYYSSSVLPYKSDYVPQWQRWTCPENVSTLEKRYRLTSSSLSENIKSISINFRKDSFSHQNYSLDIRRMFWNIVWRFSLVSFIKRYLRICK